MRAARSEWLKLVTLPSQVLTVIAAASLVLTAATVRLITAATLADTGSETAADTAVDTLLASQLHEGVVWAGALLAILAVLFVTSEYTSGSMRTTVLATPTRTPIALAKAAVLAGVGFVVGCVTSVLVLLAGAITVENAPVGFAPPAGFLTQLVLGSGLYLAGLSVLALGLTLLIRNLVAALVTVLALITVAPMLLAAMPLAWIRSTISYLPSVAGQLIFTADQGAAPLHPWGGIGVLGLWSLAALAAGSLVLKARDA